MAVNYCNSECEWFVQITVTRCRCMFRPFIDHAVIYTLAMLDRWPQQQHGYLSACSENYIIGLVSIILIIIASRSPPGDNGSNDDNDDGDDDDDDVSGCVASVTSYITNTSVH